jgi:hypothetical protein
MEALQLQLPALPSLRSRLVQPHQISWPIITITSSNKEGNKNHIFCSCLFPQNPPFYAIAI